MSAMLATRSRSSLTTAGSLQKATKCSGVQLDPVRPFTSTPFLKKRKWTRSRLQLLGRPACDGDVESRDLGVLGNFAPDIDGERPGRSRPLGNSHRAFRNGMLT